MSKDCDEEILCNWNEILIKWRKNYFERPKGLQRLVQKGIPEALRCEVWQLLTGCVQNENEMIQTYHFLLSKESTSERIIINDLNRTFPAHEYFKEQGGIGQESLYKLSRVSESATSFFHFLNFSFQRLIQFVMKKLVIVKVYHSLLRLYLFM